MSYELKYDQAKNGENTIILNDLYIHSKYNPTKEAKQIVTSKYKAHQLHIVFGYGCGYVVRELIRKCKFNEPILVLDPLVDDEKLQISEHGYTRLYYTNLHELDEISKLVSKLTSYDGQVALVENKNYVSTFANEYKNVLEAVRSAQYKEIVNVNTINLFSKDWQLNHFFNIKNVLLDDSLDKLKKVYDFPIVVASGGPSLTKQLPLIKLYRNKIILICAGSTINTLIKNEIEPDYVVSIDGGAANYHHFEHLRLSKARLIYSVMHHYKINESFKQKGLPFVPHSQQHINNYLENRFNKKLAIFLGGGSVAHYALEIAKFLTTGEIALIGQDLAYTNNQTHAIGNTYVKDVENTEKLLEIEGYNGESVKTSIALNLMLETFIELNNVSRHENALFNCTEGGAKLKNYEQLPFNEFLNRYASREIGLINIESDHQNVFKDKVYFENELNEYEKLMELLKQGDLLVRLEKGPFFKAKTLKKLEKIDEKLNAKYDYLELNTLLEATLLAAEKKFLPKVNESPQEEFERVKMYTIELYGKCREVIKDYKETIEKIITEQEELKDATK